MTPTTLQRKCRSKRRSTPEVLKAAQDGALDSSLAKVAELLDDLDVRPASKVGERVLSNNPKRRGLGSTFILTCNLPLSTVHRSVESRRSSMI